MNDVLWLLQPGLVCSPNILPAARRRDPVVSTLESSSLAAAETARLTADTPKQAVYWLFSILFIVSKDASIYLQSPRAFISRPIEHILCGLEHLQ